MFQENEITPFEDKINKDATWDNISKEKIRNFLKEVDISMRKIVPPDIMTSLNTIVFERPVERVGEKGGEKVGVKVGEKLTANRKKIIDLMIQNKTISAKQLSELVGISQRKIEENISWLKEKGYVKRIGPDKGGYWEIVNA